MPKNEAYWRDYYAPSDKFAQLFKDHSTLKHTNLSRDLDYEERKRLKVVKDLIDGKLN